MGAMAPFVSDPTMKDGVFLASTARAGERSTALS